MKMLVYFILLNWVLLYGCSQSGPSHSPSSTQTPVLPPEVLRHPDRQHVEQILQQEATLKRIETEDKKYLNALISEDPPEPLVPNWKSSSAEVRRPLIQEIYTDLKHYQQLGLPPLRDERIEQLLPTIYFEFDQSLIGPEFRNQLVEAIETLLPEIEQYKDLYIQIEGHADERGNPEYNTALGFQRANAVFDILKVFVSDSEFRLSMVSYGEELPRFSGNNETVWRANRRVSFSLLLKTE